MKCLVLAGGSGDRLWPLSRKNYPKQYMNIKNNRSLFQETIARNIPYCEEFMIVANQEHNFIVKGQLKAFQGLKYRYFFEEEGKGTAAAIAFTCTFLNPSEVVFVVSSNQMIEGKEYQEAVLKGKELAENGKLVVFGIDATYAAAEFGYIRHQGEDVLALCKKPDAETAKEYLDAGEYTWNTGMFMFRVGDFFNALKEYNPELYRLCRASRNYIHRSGREAVFPKGLMELVSSRSFEREILSKADGVKTVTGEFRWKDIGDFEALSDLETENEENLIIKEECNNSLILNTTEKQLVVTNGLEDMVVVNTADAIYISKKSAEQDIKQIMKKHQEDYGMFFDHNAITYRPWGIREILSQSDGYKVRKVTIYPGKSMTMHKHNFRSEHWAIVKGTATITLGDVTKEYHTEESVFVPVGTPHMIANYSEEDIVIIEVGIGEQITEKDMVHLKKEQQPKLTSEQLEVVRLEPAFKDYLWGGTRLKEDFDKKCEYDILAETWELSAHNDGLSVIAEGRYRGMLFDEYLQTIGKEALGWKCQSLDFFPILVKFIDAKKSLSVQVHPNDEFALSVEGEFGKNEMWYIMDCEEGASLYCGLNRDVTKEELRERIDNNTVLEVLNEVKVKKGDVLFIEAGTIHAIGEGILICEIQQNSNSTYRLYDYDRRDKFGNTRELHLDKALEVAKLEEYVQNSETDADYEIKAFEGYQERLLGRCKYFESTYYDVRNSVKLQVDDASFISIIILDGNGMISYDAQVLRFKKGDSFFVPAGKKEIVVEGKCEMIITHV